VTRILLADDQALVRGGFRMILEAQPDLEVAGEADNGATAVELALSLDPDVVLMDIRMPGIDGLEATRRIVGDRRVSTRVLVLTTFDRDEYVYTALKAGASGFLIKTAPPARLVEAVRLVASGEALLAPTVIRRLIEDYVRRPGPGHEPAVLQELTDREREVLAEIARGRSNAEIAETLVLSEATIKTHVNRILTKLGLRDRTQAVVFAYENGVVRPGDA
jgi:DNA-binding NarL/FixJ family response regulator